MNRSEWKNKEARVFYEDGGEVKTCLGRITAIDDLFLEVKTDVNRLVIPVKQIRKLKIKENDREIELTEDGETLPGRKSNDEVGSDGQQEPIF